MSKVIIIEGIIGAGKTTFAKALGKALGPNALTLLEPDEKEGANPYLADYYTDPKRWSFTMQAHLLGLRYRMHQHAQWHALNNHGHAILDRSYFGDTCFAHIQVKRGLMSQHEYETYCNLYKAMTASVMLPSVVINLNVKPETALARISKRMSEQTGRQCEATIPIDYLEELDDEIDRMCNVLADSGVDYARFDWNSECMTIGDAVDFCVNPIHRTIERSANLLKPYQRIIS